MRGLGVIPEQSAAARISARATATSMPMSPAQMPLPRWAVVAVGATGIMHALPTKSIDVIVMGARVLF
jgi:hypothetical protein